MAPGPEPVVRKSEFQAPEGPGLGLDLNEASRAYRERRYVVGITYGKTYLA